MKIVKLDIDENSILAGIDAVALVEQPAIEEDFMYFSKQLFAETYNDYPQGAIDAAKMGIKRNEELGNPCATQVGKVRAQQLVNGENLSLDTIRRMRSFLIRQKDNYDLAVSRKDYDACGYISYLLWGGPDALPWAEKKLRQAGEEFEIELSTEDIIAEELIKQEMGVDTQGLSDYINELPEDTISAIIKKLDELGEDMSEWIEVDKDEFIKEAFATITSSPNKPSVADFGNIAVRYKYSGPYDDRNRKFCHQLMGLRKVFRKEDINSLSIEGANQEFGLYDIFAYKGSYNCRHFWQEVFYKRENPITNDKKPLANSNRILDGTTLNTPGLNIPSTEITDTVKTAFAALDEKQMLVGPLMVPNKLIVRADDDGNPYYVYFTEETIKKLAYKMMKDKLIDSVNIEHDSNDKVSDAYLVESWMIEDAETDKSRNYGFNLPKGTWMGMYKIDNQKIWNEYVKTGKVKGFSVEGFFESYAMSKTVCRKNGQCACGLSENQNGLCDGSHLKK